MDTDAVAVEVVAWARAVLDELKEGRSWLTAQKTKLPDVVADVAEKTIRLADDRFPTLDIQQVALRVFEVEMAFMVEHDEQAASADRVETVELRDFADRLERSLIGDNTLSQRVFCASPIGMTFNFRLPFVQYADGTRGRQMTLSFAVAEPVQPQTP